MVGGEFGYLDRGAGPAKRKRTILSSRREQDVQHVRPYWPHRQRNTEFGVCSWAVLVRAFFSDLAGRRLMPRPLRSLFLGEHPSKIRSLRAFC